MKKASVLFVLLSLGLSPKAQIKPLDNWLEQVLRINIILAPSVEYERPIYKDFAATLRVGTLYAPSWGEPWSNTAKISYSHTGTYYYAVYPFADLDFKLIYDRDQRMRKGKHLEYNAGNYFALRCSYYYKPVLANFNTDASVMTYSIGPVWGLQRSWRGIHYAFDVGLPYCIGGTAADGTSTANFYLKFNLNVGIDLRSWLPRHKHHNMERLIEEAAAKDQGVE